VLAGFPELVSSLSPVVPWVEMLAPLLLLMPWRTAEFRRNGLLLLVAFHVAMGCVLQTGLFQVAAVVALIPFLSSSFWDRLGISDRGDAKSPGGATSLVTSMEECESSETRASSSTGWRSNIAQASVAMLFLYALAWNVVGLNVETYAAQQGLTWMKEWWGQGKTGVPLTFRDYAVEREMGRFGWIGRVTGLHQRWDMFETVGPQYRGWPVIEGTLSSGQKVRLLDGGQPANEAIDLEPQLAPRDPLAFYPGTRWLVYFTYLRTSGTQMARELLPAVVTRDWETRNPGSRLEALRILFVQPASASNESATMPGSDAAASSLPNTTEVWYDGPALR
jgi:hypothetical protein